MVYHQFLSGCPDLKDKLLQAEVMAKQKRLAFWSQSSPIIPWDWRRGTRASQSTPNRQSSQPVPSSQPSSGNLPTCVNSDCSCSDFSTQAEAQRVLEAFEGERFRWDGDKDGVACEALP